MDKTTNVQRGGWHVVTADSNGLLFNFLPDRRHYSLARNLSRRSLLKSTFSRNSSRINLHIRMDRFLIWRTTQRLNEHRLSISLLHLVITTDWACILLLVLLISQVLNLLFDLHAYDIALSLWWRSSRWLEAAPIWLRLLLSTFYYEILYLS